MAKNNVRLGAKGDKIVKEMFGGKLTTHKAPFDVVDFASGYAYEVKAMSGMSKDLKININERAMKRKLQFKRRYGIKRAYIIAVVIYSPRKVEVYRALLKRSVKAIRVKQMIRVA